MKQLLQNMKTGELRIAEVPVPALRDGGVVVRVAVSCISAGTERNIMDFAKKSYVDKARARPDLVRQVADKVRKEGLANTYKAVMSRLDVETALGYSCAGVVVEAGKTSGFSVGDRVACAGMGFASHAEYVFVPKNLVALVPPEVALADASYATIGAIAMQGVRTLEPTLGDTVVVIGLGMIGLLAMQFANASGCRAIGVDLDPRKLEVARKLGFDRVILRSDDVESAVQAWTGGIGADAVLVAATAPTNDPLELAVGLCRKRGRIGMLGTVPLQMTHKPFYEKELQLRMSTSYGPGRYDPSYELDGVDYPIGYVRWTEQRNLGCFLDLLAAKKLDVASLTTHRFAITQAEEAYALVEGKKPDEHAVGVLFEMTEVPGPLQRRIEFPRTFMSRSGKVGVGLIGAGTFTRATLLPAILGAGDVRLCGISTASGATGEKLGMTAGFAYTTTEWRQLLEDKDVDLIVVATQHRAHAAMVKAALLADKNVFVEKPLCLTRTELAEIETIAAESGRLLHVGFNRRFAPLVVQMRQHFASVREPLAIAYRINAGYAPPGGPVHREGGRIIGEVCHFLDTAVYLTGSPILSLHAASTRAGNAALADEDTVALTCQHANGHLTTILYAARGNPLLPKERIEVHGGMRSAVLDDFTSLKLFDGAHARTQRALLQDKGHKAQLQAVVAAIRDRKPAPIALADLVSVTEWTFSAVEQLRGPSEIDDEERDED